MTEEQTIVGIVAGLTSCLTGRINGCRVPPVLATPGLKNTNRKEVDMKNTLRFRRLLVVGGAVILVVAVWAGTKLGTKPVAAQAPPVDVFVFHCALIPGQPFDTSNLGSFNTTFTNSNGNFVQVSDCAQVMRDALNAGYHLKSALALPNGGPNGTGATEYVFIKGVTD